MFVTGLRGELAGGQPEAGDGHERGERAKGGARHRVSLESEVFFGPYAGLPFEL